MTTMAIVFNQDVLQLFIYSPQLETISHPYTRPIPDLICCSGIVLHYVTTSRQAHPLHSLEYFLLTHLLHCDSTNHQQHCTNLKTDHKSMYCCFITLRNHISPRLPVLVSVTRLKLCNLAPSLNTTRVKPV